MRRRCFNLAAVASLLLLLATQVLWARSYWRFDSIVIYHHGDKGFGIGSRKSSVWASWGPINLTQRYYSGSYSELENAMWQFLLVAETRWHIFGVYWVAPRQSVPAILIVRMYYPFIILAVFPAAWLIAKIRSRRSSEECSTCGYNLTGNTSGVCPECGTAIPPKAEART